MSRPSATQSSTPSQAKHERSNRRDLHVDNTPAGFTLENANSALVIDPTTGCITSLAHRLQQAPKYLAPNACGNQLQTYNDTPKDYDAWNIDPGTLDAP